MARITLDLNRFKASGVYTIEFDSSERIVVTTQTIRLVVGFSRKGPYNAPVFLRDVASSRRIFGGVDAYLEKRGSFFHRALETCLQTAPIFALNLLPLNNMPVNEGGDTVEYRSFALASAEENGGITRALLSSFFNKERFWFADTDYLQATVDSKPINRGRLLNFVNLNQEIQSIVIRKSENASLYNIIAEDYYGKGEVPPYINPTDYMSDYFVDVYVVKGDWTNLPVLAQDPVYSKYFDERGIKTDRFFEFLSLDDITLLASFTGCILPDFVDNNGSNQSIDVIVNSALAITGLFCNINKERFDNYENSTYRVDMVGNGLIPGTEDVIDFLSYNTPVKSLLTYNGLTPTDGTNPVDGFNPTLQDYSLMSGSPIPYVKSYPFGGDKGLFNNVLVLPKPYPSDTTFTVSQYEGLLAGFTTNSLIKTIGTDDVNNVQHPNDFVKVDNVIDTGSSIELHLSNPLNSETVSYIKETTCSALPDTANELDIIAFTGITPADGDIILVQAPGYMKYFEVDSYAGTTITVKATALTAVAPYFQNKYCAEGFPADEFSAYLQPTDIKVTIFDISNSDADFLVPNLELDDETFGYILSPNILYSNIEGLGQYITAGIENQVTLYNVTDKSEIAGTWHILGDATELPYDISTGEVRIVNAAGNATPFTGLTNTAGDVIRVTLPGGQIFYGKIIDQTVPNAGEFNLEAPDAADNLVSISAFAQWEAYPGTVLAKHINSNLIVSGDRVKYGTGNSEYNYITSTKNWGRSKDAYSKIAYGLRGGRIQQYKSSGLLDKADLNFADVDATYIDATVYNPSGPTDVGNDVAIYSSQAKNIMEQIEIMSPGLLGGGKKFKLTVENAVSLNIGDYVVNNSIDNPLLVRVTGKTRKLDPSTGIPYFEITVLDIPAVDGSSGVQKITRFTAIERFCDRYQFTRLSGFTLTNYHLPGTPAQLAKIYGVLEDTNLATTLVDKDVISFRYIVDTFNGGLEPNMGAKQVLSRLAKNRQKCLALLNAPSIAEFQRNTDPRFTELPEPAIGNPAPVLNTAYIAEGGNLSLGPSFQWGLPDEEQGAKYIGVFSPNIIIRENNKNISIPPAADVSNNFIRKFVIGEPYGIVAGPRRGVISNPKFVRMEYDYLLRDRENLEPVGINPITVVKNIGPMIYANQTAYQKSLSAFNNLHVRDLLITVEESIEEILQNYLFEFNDASTRLEIRSIVETYLDTVRNGGGIYEYAVIMDETNNTSDIIDQNFGIIDVAIEPARGIQKFISRITILKTGAISTGGFTAV